MGKTPIAMKASFAAVERAKTAFGEASVATESAKNARDRARVDFRTAPRNSADDDYAARVRLTSAEARLREAEATQRAARAELDDAIAAHEAVAASYGLGVQA